MALVLLILATVAMAFYALMGFEVITYEHRSGVLGLALFLYLFSLWPWGTWRRTQPG